MNTTAHTRLPPALDTALQRVRLAARSAAERTVEALSLSAMSAANTQQRDALLAGQFELNRKLAIFSLTFNESLEQQVQRQVSPRTSNVNAPTTWDTMSLVEDHEVEIKVSAERFALDIQNQCEWEIRELDQYMGAVLRLGAADHERNPLRPEIIGQAMVRAIESIADRPEVRKVLLGETGRALANLMRQTYLDIMNDLRAAGVKPLGMTVRATDGPGSQIGSYQTGYDRLSAHDGSPASGSPSALAALGGYGASHSGALSTESAALFPDVGGGWHLSRLEGRVGQYLALTGARIDGAECQALGLATHYLPSEALAEAKDRIAADPSRIEGILGQLSVSAIEAPIMNHIAQINRLFASNRYEEILAALEADGSDWAMKERDALGTKSPQTCKVALRQLALGLTFQTFAENMRQEYRIGSRVLVRHDFIEGVRALIVDKDNKPLWDPPTLAGVTEAMLDEIFAALPAGEEWTPL